MNTKIIESRPVGSYAQLNCPHCGRLFEYPTESSVSPSAAITIRCCFCQKVVQHTPGTGSQASAAKQKGTNGMGASSKKGRKIGTQERPLETGYYDTLGVSVTATD